MLDIEEKYSDSDYLERRSRAIYDLSKSFSYIESKEDGRLVLRHRYGVKMVEILDTKDDRERYEYIMGKYIEYIQKHYCKGAAPVSGGFQHCFDEEVLTKGKMPIFFAYNSNGELLGICGFRATLDLTVCGKIVKFNEISTRLPMFNKVCYGAMCFFMAYLYGLKHGQRIFSKTYPQLRDTMFKLTTHLCYHSYCTSVKVNCSYSNDYYQMADIFIDQQCTEEIKQQFISLELH